MAETLQEEANVCACLPEVGICVGKEHRGVLALRWGIQNKYIPPQGSVYLLHVKSLLRCIDGPMGGKIPVDQVDPRMVKKVEKNQNLEVQKLADGCRKICDKNKVTYKFCLSENDSVHKEIVEQISRLGITVLILENSSHNYFTRPLRGESISAYVARHAPDFCTVIVLRGGKLHSVSGPAHTRSLNGSSCSSSSAASDPRISSACESSISNDDHFEGDPSTTPGRFPQSLSLYDSQRSFESMISNSNDNVRYQDIAAGLKIRNCLTFPPKRMAPASPSQSPFHQHHWSSPDCWRSPDYNIAECVHGNFESPILEVENSASSSTLEEQLGQSPSPMDSDITFSSHEVLLRLEFDSLCSQLLEAMKSAMSAQREAERQESSFRLAEEVVSSAKKLVAEHVKQRDKALNEAKSALLKASEYEKKWVEAVAAAKNSVYKEEMRLKEEVRRCQETQNELENQRKEVNAHARSAELARQLAQATNSRCEEALVQLAEVTRKLEEECQLRKEAEERASQEAIAKEKAMLALGNKQQKYREYSFQEIQLATNNFHEENNLGRGGYGFVYKGKLHHTTVAIKVLAGEGSQGRNEFEKEVEVLSNIHHPHLVMLLGACSEKGCIVYEYMANGSLEDRLNCRGGTPPLPWYVRFRICLEVATGLLFLHSCPQPVVHRDLKPGNILLDRHFVSKIGDVGIAKLVPMDLTFSVTMYKETILMGTWSYMDPDYQRTGVVSCESDVYALGIVMLQLLTSRKPVGLADAVEKALERNQLEDVLDKSAGEWPCMEAMALARLSLQCTELRRKNRPNLETYILPQLEGIQSIAAMAAASMTHVSGPSSSRTMPTISSSIWRYHRM